MSHASTRPISWFFAVLACAGLLGCEGWVQGSPNIAESGSSQTDSPHMPGHATGDEHHPAQEPPAVAIGYGGMKRLTSREYNQTLADLFGGSIGHDGANLPDPEPTPFDNDFISQFPTLDLVENVETVARETSAIVVERMRQDAGLRDYILGCGREPTGADDRECFTSFIDGFGTRAMRRPISDEMRTRYIEEFFELKSLRALDDAELRAAAEELDFYQKIEHALQAMLQSADFIYRRETGTPVEGMDWVYELDDYEVASRLSYFLWGTMPDDTLLEAAANDELSSAAQVRDQAERMLDDSRALRGAAYFHAMWLGFDGFYRKQGDGEFTDPALAADARAETRELLNDVIFERDTDWREIFTTDKTWLSADLAAHYDLPAPDNAEGGWVVYPDDSMRGGIFSHASFLTMGSQAGTTNIIARGKYMLDYILCNPLPPPPANAEGDKPETPEPECKDDHLDWLTMRPGCIDCHATLNGPGLSLENFDGAGRYREVEPDTEGRCEIEGEGQILEPNSDGEWVAKHSWTGPAGLGEFVVEQMDVGSCMTKHLYQYALGHKVSAYDRPAVERLASDFEDSGYRYRELVLDLVSSPEFRFRTKLEEGG